MFRDDARQFDATYETVMDNKPLCSVLARSLNRKDLDLVDEFLKDNGCQRLHRHKLPYCSDKVVQFWVVCYIIVPKVFRFQN